MVTMIKAPVFLVMLVAAIVPHNEGLRFSDPLGKLIKAQLLKQVLNAERFNEKVEEEYLPVYVGAQDGLKESDKVEKLPGQPPNGVEFGQYSGYVTVDPKAGRALFYYFVESPPNPATKPLMLWLTGGPGCSSFGDGAMLELGPFRVKSDGQTLHPNAYAWNKVANIIFLESPAGVGFSYSNTTSDYKLSGDKRTAEDSYTFLVNWLERFPEYKMRDFFIAGDSYSGHYTPQLAQLILQNNKIPNPTVINLKGIAIGNAYLDFETTIKGMYDFYWTHALISDEIMEGINSNCDFSTEESVSQVCAQYLSNASQAWGDIFIDDIYTPSCDSSSNSSSDAIFDPCSYKYVQSYLNNPQVQKALHANITSIPGPWASCSAMIEDLWNDKPLTVLPVIKELMASGITIWIYSGDTDGVIPVTSTRYSINKLGTSVKTKWYPWFNKEEVGGYAVEYQNLTFVTVRGAGHYVPSYQPSRAFTLFSSFIQGNLLPKYKF